MAHSPHKALELHYPMIQFLIKTNKPLPAEQECRSIRVFTQNLEQEKGSWRDGFGSDFLNSGHLADIPAC